MKKDITDIISETVAARVKDAFEAGRKAGFIAAVEECQAYSKSTKSEEAKAVAMNLAVRITQRAKKGG